MVPLVFVHGNPETADLWDPLAEALYDAGRTRQLRLSPPGFGAPVPAEFEATPTGYAAWLVDELERLGEPADVIGHDWGGVFTLLAAAAAPQHFRSWASDAFGLLHPDYAWHDLARLWQTPDAGEEWVQRTLAGPSAQFAEALAQRGMPAPTAARIAPAFDAGTGRCILSLYRAARQPAMAELGSRLGAAAARPGLAIIAVDDVNSGSVAQRREAAAVAGAQVVELPRAGHWWMAAGDQDRVVAALAQLWSRCR